MADTMLISPDATFIYNAWKDYQQVSGALKVLRAKLPRREEYPEDIDAARSLATGWFNRLALMVFSGHINAATFRHLCPPVSGALWLELVAPLDREILQQVHGVDVEPAVETFYRAYCEHGVVAIPPTDAEARVQALQNALGRLMRDKRPGTTSCWCYPDVVPGGHTAACETVQKLLERCALEIPILEMPTSPKETKH